jgi:hypothetical protein
MEASFMEITANAVQVVAANQNVLFTDTVICGNGSIIHRPGSGLVTLRGITNQCRARFKVSFGGNIAVPATGTAGPISLAIAINGESVPSTTMIETPTAVDAYSNVFSAVYVDVPACCCTQISVKNIGADSISVQNANLIVERVA